MKSQSLLAALTLVNAVLLIFLLLQPHRTSAQEVAPVIRARALEIVDDQGRVRAAIRVFPPDPKVKMPVEDGSGISLGGDSNPTNIQILARGANTSLKLINKDGKQQFVKP